MNLFWKKLLGRLTPTDRFEKLEADFMHTAEKLSQIKNSPLLTEYKKLNLELKLSSSANRKAASKRIATLKKNPEVQFYINQSRKKSSNDLTLTFNDDFYWRNIEDSRWKPGFHFNNEKLLRNYSFENEKQAYNQGNNISVYEGILSIHTRKQSLNGLAWHPVRGFSEKNFPFTSDVIQTAGSFNQRGGIFKAKIRCSGPVHHAWWLASETQQPHINLFHFNGKEIQMGYVNQNNGDGITIKGINPEEFYIYSLRWTKDELIWYINNLEVFRASNDIPWQELHLIFNSFIPEQIPGEEGNLEIDWVRVYQFNS